jgi:hypothetical protein
MSLPRRQLSALGLLALVLAAGLLGACGTKAPTAPTSKAPDTSVAALTQMTPAEKTSQIATSFPIQVPVAAGAVVRAEAQGDSAWVYQIIVSGEVAPVRNWYRQMYGNANWAVVREGDNELTLQKGSAETRLQFESVDNGNEARTQVTAAVGVGTPVLQTQ